MGEALPQHYQTTIRRLIRFAVIGMALGMLLGVMWTEFGKSVRYGQVARKVEPKEGRIRLELPPGKRWEAGLGLKLSHGHAMLIAGVIPLLFALSLFLVANLGGKEINATPLATSFWLYVSGATGALVVLFYKGLAGFLAVRGGAFDLAEVEASLFMGSRAVKGLSYGITHSCMAVGLYVFLFQLWKASGPIGRAPAPAAPPAE